MVLTLEALRARHGDALLLHHGTAEEPRLIVIDGGPSGVFRDALEPRLRALHAAYGARGALRDGVLVPEIVLVSHIDDDHLRGLLDLTGALLAEHERGRAPWLRPRTLWHNAFEALTGTGPDELPGGGAVAELAALGGLGDAGDAGDVDAGVRQAAAVLASVRQGDRLRTEAEQLGWRANRPFEGLVQAPDAGGQTVELEDGLTLRVLAPRAAQVEGLRREWREQLAKLRKRGAPPAEAAEYLDASPYNLSSIVLLAEREGRRILLTGDARGDHVLEALEAAGELEPGGTVHVDVLKLPHHGSIRNVERDFFARIAAAHYVVSADGKHGNPETETLELIAASRTDDDFAIHLTYAERVGDLKARIERFVRAHREAGRTFAVLPRPADALAVRIDLLDPLGH